MKKLLILLLALTMIAGCADSDYVNTASHTGSTFKMVKVKPVNGRVMGIGGHQATAS